MSENKEILYEQWDYIKRTKKPAWKGQIWDNLSIQN
jgi:hypothetical protein